jgi:hypothetical protein
MNDFKVRNGIRFTHDLKGVAIIDQENGAHFFLEYPEAAVWSVLAEQYGTKKSIEMIGAILGYNATETRNYIAQSIRKWKDINIIS